MGPRESLDVEAHDCARRLGDGPQRPAPAVAHRMGACSTQFHEQPRTACSAGVAADARHAGAGARSAVAGAARSRGLPAVHRQRADAPRRGDARGNALARDACEADPEPGGHVVARQVRRGRQRRRLAVALPGGSACRRGVGRSVSESSVRTDIATGAICEAVPGGGRPMPPRNAACSASASAAQARSGRWRGDAAARWAPAAPRRQAAPAWLRSSIDNRPSLATLAPEPAR